MAPAAPGLPGALPCEQAMGNPEDAGTVTRGPPILSPNSSTRDRGKRPGRHSTPRGSVPSGQAWDHRLPLRR